MKHCTGPCDQGNKPCPTPEACELSPSDEGVWRLLGKAFLAVVLAAAIVVCLAL